MYLTVEHWIPNGVITLKFLLDIKADKQEYDELLQKAVALEDELPIMYANSILIRLILKKINKMHVG
jgi:hypothetical protein